MNRIVIILLLLVWHTRSYAQANAVVIDMETRKPLRDVTVYTDTQKEMKTDWTGRFKTNEKFGSATISHGNYLKRTIRREDMRDTITLLPLMNELAEVVILGKKPGEKFMYNNMTTVDAQLQNYKGGGFNLLGLAVWGIKSLVIDKHKMTKKQRAKQIIDNY